MKKVINCNKQSNALIKQKLKEVSVEEGYEIATELFQILNKRGDGIGLAANQVGIDAQVAVLNVREPLVLINPKIISKKNQIDYYEGCLSFPGEGVRTKRYKDVTISTEQSKSEWIFNGEDSKLKTLEAVCIQHEIDHLNGIVCMDRKINIQHIASKVPGRNELCFCGSGKKYKKCCLNKKR